MEFEWNYVRKKKKKREYERLHYGSYKRSVHSFEIHMKTPMKYYQKPKVPILWWKKLLQARKQ